MRITYIIESLSNSGGMERVVTTKANWLKDNANHDVTIITFAQEPEVNDYFPLSDKVNRVKYFFEVFNTNDLFYSLTDWLKNNPQDICISTYGREFNILPQIKDGSKKIVEFHFAYDVNEQWQAVLSANLKSYVIGKLKTWRMTHTAIKYDKIVCLTKADYKKWRKHTEKVIQIYNPLTIYSTKTSDCTPKQIIAIGRMDMQKGFDFLIDCWEKIEDKHPDWQLEIFGNGDASILREQISNLGLQHIKIHGPTNNVPDILRKSSIYVLSSRYEGFPLIICEAMSCGLPIVAFDCPSGPAELISDGENGYLIKRVGDIKTMANHLSHLIEHENLRKSFGKKSLQMSKKYTLDHVMQKWINLFNQIIYPQN